MAQQTYKNRNADVSAKANSLKEEAKQQAKTKMQQAGQEADKLKDQAQTKAKDMAQTQKAQAASELNSVAEAIRSGGNELRNQNKENVAHYTEKIAEQIEQASRYIDERNVEELVTDMADFARRRPEVFLGGAFMVGVALGRFLTSSNQPSNSSYNYYPNDNPGRPSTRQVNYRYMPSYENRMPPESEEYKRRY